MADIKVMQRQELVRCRIKSIGICSLNYFGLRYRRRKEKGREETRIFVEKATECLSASHSRVSGTISVLRSGGRST